MHSTKVVVRCYGAVGRRGARGRTLPDAPYQPSRPNGTAARPFEEPLYLKRHILSLKGHSEEARTHSEETLSEEIPAEGALE